VAPLPVIANTYRVAFNWTNDANAQIAENVMHFIAPGSSALAVAEAIDGAVTSAMFQTIASNAGCDTLSVTPLDGTSATLNYTTTSEHFTGSASGDFSPASAVVVSLGTGLRGRSHRGRLYLGFTAEGVISDGSIEAGTASSLQAAWLAFIDELDAGVTWAVASYKLATAQAVSSVGVKAAIGTQRRRQTRVRYA
jgi:hypothetical protein